MDSIEQFKQELWILWRQQLGRLPEVVEAAGGERTVYSRVPLFDLKQYTPRKFPAGGCTLSELPPQNELRGSQYYVYRLDERGRPVHMTSRHIYNRIDWQGMYRYRSTEVEYVEFCVQSQVPSQYDRMTLQGSQPASFQEIRINCGGYFPKHHGADAIDWIISDCHRYLLRIEQYEIYEDKVVSGRALREGFGLPAQRSTLYYSYSSAGKLERIFEQYEGESKRTVFAARSKTSLRVLSTELSERIATRTFEVLSQAVFDSPLVAVELSYRSVECYVPSVVPATERDSISSLTLVVAIDPSHWIDLPAEDFEPEMTEFMKRISSAERHDLGGKMLRRAALLVTRLARGHIWASENFVAFAIDWEMEAENLTAILKQCGADPRVLKIWNEKGWLG